MIKEETALEGVYIITPEVFGDNRGWFYESYSKRALLQLGIDASFVQDNRSYSQKKGTLRGLHCQKEPHSQAKLVSCTRGKILDVAVDIRPSSPTYLKFIKVELSAENKKMLFIPKGFLHGFVTLTEDVELLYKADDFYFKDTEMTVRFDDPQIGIDWGEGEFTLSEKDKNALTLSEQM